MKPKSLKKPAGPCGMGPLSDLPALSCSSPLCNVHTHAHSYPYLQHPNHTQLRPSSTSGPLHMLSPHLEHSPSCLSVGVASLELSQASFPWSPCFSPSQHPLRVDIVLLTTLPLDCRLSEGRTASLLPPPSPRDLGQSRHSKLRG